MSETPKNAETEIEPLSDESLEEVAGGAAQAAQADGICSIIGCSNDN